MKKKPNPVTDTPMLDWKSRHDERSRAFPIREALPAQIVREKTLWFTPKPVIDQGREGACVGFGWTNELRALPVECVFPDPTAFALGLYKQAQKLDDQPGENYSGTSVLAGAKACQALGFMTGYRWAFSIDDVIDALVAQGPVVLGIPWYDSMYRTRPSGLIDVSGKVVGGHCILATGYSPKQRFLKEGLSKTFEVIRLRNSWGPTYGNGGDGWIRVSDLAALLKDQGEACIPMGRKKP
jgi:hypothetical protein